MQHHSAPEPQVAATQARLLETWAAGVRRSDARAYEGRCGALLADRCRIGRGDPAVRLSLGARPGACLAASVSGVIAGIASVSLTFGFVHGITLGFGVTLIGEAVDYAIYLLTQTAPGAASATTSPTHLANPSPRHADLHMRLQAMLLSSFTGFSQLGLFTITGLIAALAVTRWVLPVLSPRGSATTDSYCFATPMLALIRAAAPFASSCSAS